jgi:hypothetical protein
MKIGIMTFWWSQDNYGQLLQCYALQKYLRDLGHEAFLIRYKEQKQTFNIVSLLKIFNPVKVCRYIIEKKFLKQVQKDELLHSRNFDLFRTNYIKQSEYFYSSYNDLKDNPPEADIYIVGSDQVWNFDNLRVIPQINAFFLNFGNESIIRISYSASFGIEKLSNEVQNYIKPLIQKFKYVSVREKSGEKICNEMDVSADVVCDPTLLLDGNKYLTTLQIQNNDSNYIFVYHVNVFRFKNEFLTQINTFATSNNLVIKSVSASGYIAARKLIKSSEYIYASIPEWLSLIANSKYVLTTSFHGTVFAIIMHKPFLTITLDKKYSRSNDRFRTLLKTLGLESRIYKSGVPIADQLNQPIDWDRVDSCLKNEKNKSMEFLNKALK